MTLRSRTVGPTYVTTETDSVNVSYSRQLIMMIKLELWSLIYSNNIKCNLMNLHIHYIIILFASFDMKHLQSTFSYKLKHCGTAI